MPLSNQTLFKLGFGCLLVFIPCAVLFSVFSALVLYQIFKPEAVKEKEAAADMFDSTIISPCPPNVVYFRTLDYNDGGFGTNPYCTAAYTLRPEDFSQILKAHKWVRPVTVSAADEFHQVWPEYTGEIEQYYYDDGDPGPNASNYSTIMAVSKDHTKLVFSSADYWERSFDKQAVDPMTSSTGTQGAK